MSSSLSNIEKNLPVDQIKLFGIIFTNGDSQQKKINSWNRRISTPVDTLIALTITMSHNCLAEDYGKTVSPWENQRLRNRL